MQDVSSLTLYHVNVHSELKAMKTKAKIVVPELTCKCAMRAHSKVHCLYISKRSQAHERKRMSARAHKHGTTLPRHSARARKREHASKCASALTHKTAQVQ